MPGSDSREEGEKSPPQKRTRGANKGSKTVNTRSKGEYHDLSDSDYEKDGDEKTGREGESGGFSTNQMREFASMISATMGTAFAQAASTHALGAASFPPNSSQDGGRGTEEQESEDDTGKENDEVDDYDKNLDCLLDKQEAVGQEISEKVGRVLGKCLGSALDEKMVKEKRDEYPRPSNVLNLAVSKLNQEIYKRISAERQWADRAMQQIQSYLVAGLSAVGYQAEVALKVRAWMHGLKEEEKETFPPEMFQMAKMYVALMD